MPFALSFRDWTICKTQSKGWVMTSPHADR